MDDVKKIAEGLTKAGREMLLAAKVSPPHPIMPDYWSVEIIGSADPKELQDAGLVTLPIRMGDRSWTRGYRGEIHSLGLAVRAYLKDQEHG